MITYFSLHIHINSSHICLGSVLKTLALLKQNLYRSIKAVPSFVKFVKLVIQQCQLGNFLHYSDVISHLFLFFP